MAVMCAGCPFREPGERRLRLLLYIVERPDRGWPCHKDMHAAQRRPCGGREIFAAKVAQLTSEDS